MTSRNPKEIRQIVTDSQKDMSDMQSSLAKLRGLSEDDKTENAMLRSRIDEQSKLIMILKQRADEVTEKMQTLEKINSELLEFRDQAKDKFDYELKRYRMLDKRFHDLASNHQEIIKYKDEYKRVNFQLRAENSKLRDDNAALFSKALVDKETEINQLSQKFTSLREVHTNLEIRFKQIQQEFRGKEEGYKTELQSVQDSNKTEVKSLQSKLADTEERVKAANYKLQCQSESQKSADSERQMRLQQLTKEKDELLDLAMQRGKLIQKEQADNKKLQKNIEEMEKAVKRMEEKFERDAAAVNGNLQVKKLRQEMDQTESKCSDISKEFEAFKKHSNSMLQKERELNERLRHLAG